MIPELAGMTSFETPHLELVVFLPVHCSRCFAPYSAHLESGIYTHPHTECSLNTKRYMCKIGTHGQVTVIEVQPPGDNFLG